MALPANTSNLINSLSTAVKKINAADTSGVAYLKMTKAGEWIFGADEVEVNETTEWAINPDCFSVGYACWGDGVLLDEKMALVTDDAILKSDLPTLSHGWKDQVGMQLACLEGVNEGQQVVYTATSKGGSDAFKAVVEAVVERATAGKTDIIPVVCLTTDSYKHKKYGKVYTPVFNIIGWEGGEESAEPEPVAEVVEPEPVVEVAAKPTRRRAKA